MSDQNITNATPAPSEPSQQAAAPDKTGGKVYTEEQVEQLLKERLTREKARAEKQVNEAAEKAAAEAAAKNGEWEKLAKQREADLAKLTNELNAQRIAQLKRDIAAKLNIPANLALRLVGETEQDIEADAKTLLETLPKPPKPSAGVINNPDSGATQTETEAQKRARLWGQPADPYTIEGAKQLGGGWVISE